jgi:hypothetical protein
MVMTATCRFNILMHMAIGDINSAAPGSGARFNDGKALLELLPIYLVAQYHHSLTGLSQPASRQVLALYALGRFQAGGGIADLHLALQHVIGDDWSECAHVFDYGRKKYAEWNWAKGMPWSVPIACAARHLLAIERDEQAVDTESGRTHFGHAACNIVMLLTYISIYRDGDDRPAQLQGLLDGY